jgi:hypothetical protein
MQGIKRIILLILCVSLGVFGLGTSSAQEDFTTWVVAPFVTGGGVAATPTVTSNQITVGIPSCQSKLIMGNPAFNGSLLTDVLGISYTYTVNNAGASASFIHINMYIDTNADGNNDTRLDFIPGGNSTGVRSHNPLTDAFWSGGVLVAGSSWTDILAAYPGASIAQTTFATPGYPSLIFNIGDTGCSWNGWNGIFGAPIISIAGVATGGSGSNTRFMFRDGRINNYDTATPIAAYGLDMDDERGLIVYEIGSDSRGVWVLLVTPEEIAAVPELPETNTLIAQTETDNLVIYFWRLSSGEFQLNVIQPNGKMYVLIFTVLDTGGGGYTSFEYDMQ